MDDKVEDNKVVVIFKTVEELRKSYHLGSRFG
jgi:hypothetical protein